MTLPPLSSASKRALSKLGITYPIIQAPMAGTSTPLLASTISNAGGLGSIGLGASNSTAAKKMILDTRKLLDPNKGGKFNVNFFVHSTPQFDPSSNLKWLEKLKPHFERYGGTIPEELKVIYKSFKDDDDMLNVLLETKPPIISFHFGIPPIHVLRQLKDIGSVLMVTATSIEEAQKIEKEGEGLVDFIVAQGYEAGGHRGIFDPNGPDEKLPTFVLCSLLLSTNTNNNGAQVGVGVGVKTPIIAAGGIMNGRHIKTYLDLGCAAVQLGTAFIGCPESSVDQGFREALFNPDKSRCTMMTKYISGRPARSICNKFTDLEKEIQLEGGEVVELPEYPITYDAGKALHAAAKAQGEYGYGAQWAGQGAPLARKLDAKEMLETLVREWKEAEGMSSA
ncbi:uncharacterized protein I303_108370 [Kwoniella dejecticola CBS 10117]|uniref:Uncharacterized protein n=1 Tax=Kwoniella dejecticola CBS 10117 TaxID=1296121 RepID=A0A1A5ZXL0_9TREE|nr:uncharacterized protein I303_07303 [Kwoniella dejecticola CBS 10117]OBR82543.1 hypothetical protein I303_07303 [Kwoniella dejecticola CBS 10117]